MNISGGWTVIQKLTRSALRPLPASGTKSGVRVPFAIRSTTSGRSIMSLKGDWTSVIIIRYMPERRVIICVLLASAVLCFVVKASHAAERYTTHTQSRYVPCWPAHVPDILLIGGRSALEY